MYFCQFNLLSKAHEDSGLVLFFIKCQPQSFDQHKPGTVLCSSNVGTSFKRSFTAERHGNTLRCVCVWKTSFKCYHQMLLHHSTHARSFSHLSCPYCLILEEPDYVGYALGRQQGICCTPVDSISITPDRRRSTPAQPPTALLPQSTTKARR